ncbi:MULTISPECIES: Sec-independent protein translocase subunit TatA/TatB, partial [Enorma]|uniref:Sec-independent protein translocase subunit TatA/TatB n=1 Tax=Enorma TaxID=1472762 RepID=UPI000370AF84
MFGIGQTEFIIIIVFAFLLFGPDKLPQAGKTIGRAIRQFRETQQKVTSVVQTEVIDPMAAAASASTPSKQAAVDEDADADAPADAAAKAPEARKETFAERRARLAAEKAEREAAAGAADGAA